MVLNGGNNKKECHCKQKNRTVFPGDEAQEGFLPWVFLKKTPCCGGKCSQQYPHSDINWTINLSLLVAKCQSTI